MKQVRQKIEDAVALLDKKPLDLGKFSRLICLVQSKKEKADLLYLRGKCLDYIPEYTK